MRRISAVTTSTPGLTNSRRSRVTSCGWRSPVITHKNDGANACRVSLSMSVTRCSAGRRRRRSSASTWPPTPPPRIKMRIAISSLQHFECNLASGQVRRHTESPQDDPGCRDRHWRFGSSASRFFNSGNRAGRHSLRVNEQYRVTFRWENGHAYEVRVEDYHWGPHWLGPAIPPGELLLEVFKVRRSLVDRSA